MIDLDNVLAINGIFVGLFNYKDWYHRTPSFYSVVERAWKELVTNPKPSPITMMQVDFSLW